MASVVGICNKALVLCGANRIISLEDANPNARICDEVYTDVRDSLLRRHPWNFAAKRDILAELTTIPSWGYDHAYQVPVDSLFIEEVDSDLPWVVENGMILTDEGSPLSVKYRSIIEDPNQMDAAFRMLLSYELAVMIAPDLTQSKGKLQELKDGTRDARKNAYRADAQEGTVGEFTDDEWLTARL